MHHAEIENIIKKEKIFLRRIVGFRQNVTVSGFDKHGPKWPKRLEIKQTHICCIDRGT